MATFMKLFSHFIPVLFLLFLFPVEGQTQQVFQLNSIDTQAKQAPAQTVSGKTQQRVYYALNETPLSESRVQKGDRISVQTSPDSDTQLIIDRVENYTDKTTTFIARDPQQKENSFTFTYAGGRLNGVFHKSHEDIFFFESDSQTQQNYVAKGASYYDDEKFCSVHEAEQNMQAFVHSGTSQKARATTHSVSHTPNLLAMASTLEDEITIDILIPYTEKAANWATQSEFNSIEEVISQAVGLSQAALDNSEVNITLRLVHFYQTDYDGDSASDLDESDPDYVSSGDHLRRLTRNPALPFELCSNNDEGDECSEEDYDGYMEEVHNLRQEYGADLVAAVLSEPNTGGIAWRNGRIAGNPVYGFSINRVQQIASGTTLIHEIGHNMGNAHARNQPESPAGDFGGIYVYSTGNRFSVEEDNYATVMAYTTSGYQSIPYFSSPDISFLETTIGHPLSYTGSAGPSDNVRSMRENKRVIASYQPSTTDPPVVDADVSSISVSLDQENSTASIPISITNNGDSDLMWDLDFDTESSVVAKQKSGENIKEIKPIRTEKIPERSGNQLAGLAEDGTIFSTGFESIEGFGTGDHTAITGWRSFSTDIPFEISSENPSDGNNHLRLAYQGASFESHTYARSPSFGPQPFGEFSVSFDMALENAAGSSDQRFDVYIYDGSTSSISSGLVIKEGHFLAWNVNESGQEVFSSTGSNFQQNGSYQNIEIRYNPNNKSVDYYLDGTQIASNQYSFGRKPDYIYFSQSNHEPEAIMDIDNIEVKRLHTPFNWLSAEKTGGVVSPSSSQTLDLNLTANNVETGTYETILLLYSNDPENAILEIPITAEIEMATSGELIQTRPEKVSLAQNYPNPFNPTTTIEYTLGHSADVELNVYNITGQKVATLFNETMPGGTHEYTFDASSLSSGIYIYRLQTPSETLTRQMVLIK